MDMHKKRELRAKKKQVEKNEEPGKMNINWYERIYVPCPSIPYKIRRSS